MKRIPRRLKKIAKKSIGYSTTEFYNCYSLAKYPKHGIAFIIPNGIKTNKKTSVVIIFGKKTRFAYYSGLFDF